MAPDGNPLIVVLVVLPVVVTPPGDLVIVQLPLGNPLNTTLPVGVVHMGCVIAPTTGAPGKALTIILLVDIQPVDVSVNVNVVVPAVTPVTTPELFTVAIAIFPLVQVPPIFGVTLAMLPTHTAVAPPNTGKALTTIVPVAFTVPHPPVNGMV